MNRFKVNAFFSEFPFLTSGENPIIKNIDSVEQVTVSRVDADFLLKIPQYDGARGSYVDIEDQEEIFLLDQNGDILNKVVQEYFCKENGNGDDLNYPGESVGEALLSLDDPNQVQYAVLIHTGFVIQDHRSVAGYSVVLYKSPKGFTLKGWMEEQQKRAQEKLAATIVEIDII